MAILARIPRLALLVLVLVVVVVVVVGGWSYLSAGKLASHPLSISVDLEAGPWVEHCNTSAIGDPASAEFSVYNVTVNSVSATITTSNFGVDYTEGGAGPNPNYPGPGSTAGPGSCPGVDPRTTYVAVLLSPSHTPEAFLGDNSTWTALGTSVLPITLVPSQTIDLVTSANLNGVSLLLYGVNGASVSGSATLP